MQTTRSQPSGIFRNVRLDFSKGGGIVIAFLALCLVLTIASPRFFTATNLLIVARQTVFVMIIGFAMTS